jgi:hypothetical protein
MGEKLPSRHRKPGAHQVAVEELFRSQAYDIVRVIQSERHGTEGSARRVDSDELVLDAQK